MTKDDLPDDLPMPMPLEIADADEVGDSVFGPDGPTMRTPLGAAWLWWMALNNLPDYRTALQNLSYNPEVWNGYDQVGQLLDGWSLMSVPVERPEPADDIAAIKFMRDTGHTMRAFAEAPLNDVMVLTMVLCDDSLWRAWGVSHNEVPSNNRVRFGRD